MPSILVVEDHPFMAQMLSRLLHERGKLEIWGMVETAEAALAALAANALKRSKSSSENNVLAPPDLVVVDLSLPGMNGMELLTELGQLYPNLPCLVVSAHSHPSYAQRVLDRGARGYVAKEDAITIVDAVKRVLKGEVYLSDKMRQTLKENED